MKKTMFYFLTLILAIAFGLPMAASADQTITIGFEGSQEFPLYMGRKLIPVGKVIVTNDMENLSVEYVPDAPWLLAETHVHVASSIGDIPQTRWRKNPRPGKFDYKTEYEQPVPGDTYVIPLENGPQVVIAAHAEIVQVVEEEIVEDESAWAGDDPFGGRNWARKIEYEVYALGAKDYGEDPEFDEVNSSGEIVEKDNCLDEGESGYWAKLEVPLDEVDVPVPAGSEARIWIPFPDGTQLGNLVSIQWDYYLVSGYPPHADLLLDDDCDGVQDEAIVFEYAYNPAVDGDPVTFPNVDNGWPSYGAQTDMCLMTFDTPDLIDDDAWAWLNSGPAGPPDWTAGRLSAWKSEDGLGDINEDTCVLGVEIEIDSWRPTSPGELAYVDNVVIVLNDGEEEETPPDPPGNGRGFKWGWFKNVRNR